MDSMNCLKTPFILGKYLPTLSGIVEPFLIHFSVFLQEKSHQKSYIENFAMLHVTIERREAMKLFLMMI